MAELDVSSQMVELRERIARWKQSNGKRSRMPSEMWSAAMRFAREMGVYGASRALGVSYDSLRRRAEETGKNKRAEFVELDARAVIPTTGAVIVELSRGDGARMTVRAGEHLDVGAVVVAFLGRSQ